MLRQWLKSLLSTTPTSRRPNGRSRVRPALEALEDRRVMSATAAGSVFGGNQSYLTMPDGSLAQYTGNTQVSTIVGASYASTHGGIAQVSAGIHGQLTVFPILSFPSGAAFVRFGDGTVNEYYHGSTPGWSLAKVGTGASEISASQIRSDAVFIRYGGWVDEHVGLNSSAGLTTIERPGYVANIPSPGASLFGIPLPGPHDACQISAGKDAATGNEAVFINFQGAGLYEHTGSSMSTGWSLVTSGVTGFSASQVQGNTVFVNKSGALSEYVSGTGTAIATSVASVSAGMDKSGKAAAFVLTKSGTLYEHTGMNALNGWTTIATGVSRMDASQVAADTVFYEKGKLFDKVYQVRQHSGASDKLVYELDTPY
jgi:hypothetical protein